MATLSDFSVIDYNNTARMDDLEHATWLLSKVENDVHALMTYLERVHERYDEGLPQALCDQVGQVGEDILDRLRTVDPAYLAEIEAREQRALHETYLMHIGYAAAHIAAGHE